MLGTDNLTRLSRIQVCCPTSVQGHLNHKLNAFFLRTYDRTRPRRDRGLGLIACYLLV